MAEIGKNIRLLRMQKGMTQDELAEKLFVSRQTVSNYETGRSQPDIDTLLRIAEALDVGAQAILYGTADTLEQLAAKKRAIAASFAVAGLAIVYHLLTQVRKAFVPRYLLGGLFYPLLLLLRPALFLLAGWTVMQLVSVLTKARPLRTRWAKGVFWGVTAFLIMYCVLVLPMCGWAIWSDWSVWQLHLSGEDFNFSRSFSVTPWWDAAVLWIVRHIDGLSVLFPLAGVTLWLTGGRKAPTPEPEKPANTI